MAKAVAARMKGDDYQAYHFWLQICRLFEDRSRVSRVTIEADDVKSLDDVVVDLAPPVNDAGEEVSREFYQVKFHMSYDGSITCEALTDPAFINATKNSLLQRIADAHQQLSSTGQGYRFIIFSPWVPHPENELAQLCSADDGRLDLHKLATGGPTSKMGKVRALWRDHLQLTSDDALFAILRHVRILATPQMGLLHTLLNAQLQVVGMAPVSAGSRIHPYLSLSQNFIKTGTNSFGADDIEQICRREGLWRGRTPFEPDARILGIRSFSRGADFIEDTTDAHLCLLNRFAMRKLAAGSTWDSITESVTDFLAASTSPGRRNLLHLPAHGSIAFASGYYLDPKTGIDVLPVQPGLGGRAVWGRGSLTGKAASQWSSETVPIRDDGHQLAVALSATRLIRGDVELFANRALPEVGRILHLQLPHPGPESISSGEEAFSLAQEVIDTIHGVRSEDERHSPTCLFWAAPNGFAFFLGQLGRALGPCELYEYDFDSMAPGAYARSMSFPLVR